MDEIISKINVDTLKKEFLSNQEKRLKIGVFYKSENDNQSNYLVCVNFKELKPSQCFLKIYIIDPVDDDIDVGEILEVDSTVEMYMQRICTLQLCGKYFFPKFKNDMQLYYDDSFYGKDTKADQIQSLADVINFAIRLGFKTSDVSPI